MHKTYYTIALTITFIAFLFYFNIQPRIGDIPKIQTLEHVLTLFPKNRKEVQALVHKTRVDLKKNLDSIYALADDKRTFKNTFEAYDKVAGCFQINASIINIISLVTVDDDLRQAAQEANNTLQELAITEFTQNQKLYEVLCIYNKRLNNSDFAKSEALTDVDMYCLNRVLEDYQRQGLQLPQAQQDEIMELKKGIAKLELEFEMNIAKDNRFIEVTKDELQGVSKHFRKSLVKTKDKKYKIGTDYPTFNHVMENCSHCTTRENLFKEFDRRGYPANEEVLKKIITLRDKLAHILGYKSYADYDISDQMAKNTKRVEEFLNSIIKPAQIKANKEIALFRKNSPIALSAGNKILPWDLNFIKNDYKKNILALDETKISEYLPLEYTLPALLGIYEKFFGITFNKLEAKGLWHNSVKMLAVYRHGQFIGTILLDLFPRPFKYSHAAQWSIIPSVKRKSGEFFPALAVVVANFPPASETMPALLKRDDAITFFHEFGHALHTLLGTTPYALFSGTNVKNDFVEMPSQMLEQWMWDPTILKLISKHYKTNEPLTDDLITKIISLKDFDKGDQTLTQIIYAFISLDFFKTGEKKDLSKIFKETYETIKKNVYFYNQSKRYCSFGHLMGYGAKYYGYLWSKVFALDLFERIKANGLLNHTIGSKYCNEVIGQGGSKDPEFILRTFLGREPNTEAFFKELGVLHDTKN